MAVANIYRVVQDVAGNIVDGVLGTVTLTGTSTLAALFNDSAGTLPLPNPTTNNAQYGSFNLFLAAGTYDMQFVKAGYTFETQRNIVLRDPTLGVNLLFGTVNQVIVSSPGYGTVTLSLPQDHAPDSNVQFAHLGLNTPATSNALTVNGVATVVALGIGTAGPIYPLHVEQSALINGPLGVESVPDDLYSLKVGADSYFVGRVGVGATPNASFGLGVSGQTLLAGNVAVGDGTLPVSQNLRVSGTTLLNGFTGIQSLPDSLYSLKVGADSYFVGRVGVGATPNASFGLGVSGQTLLAGNVAVGDGTLPVSQNLRVSGTTLLNGFTGIQSLPDSLYSLKVGADSYFVGRVGVGATPNASFGLAVSGQTLLAGNVAIGDGTLPVNESLRVNSNASFGLIGVGRTSDATAKVAIAYLKASNIHGIQLAHSGGDTGSGQPITFLNAAYGLIGSITTTASTTAYNTSSDIRLKHDVTTLTGELAVIQALRPVRFKWNVDDSEGVSFLAQEVATHLAGVITGDPDGVHEDGTIRPQMIDMSKLVPWIVGAIQTLAQRLEVVEDAAGI